MNRFIALASLNVMLMPTALAAGGGNGGPFEWLTHPATNVAFAALVIFLLIAWRAGGFKAILGALDARAASIQTQLSEAKDLREAAAKMLADAERRQKQADEDAEAIIKQAKKDAKAMREEARVSLDQRLERREAIAEARIRQAENDATAEVRETAADAAISAAQQLLSKQDSGDQFEAAAKQIETALN